MRNPMNRRLPRELKSDFAKYLVIFLFIVMVVSVVSSFLVANAGVAKAYKDNLKNGRVENGHLAFNVRPDDALLAAIEEKAGIKLYPADFFEETNDGTTLRVYKLGSDVNLPNVTEGRLPQSAGEIALDNQHSEQVGIKVGDTIPVDGHTVLVTGLVALPNYSALFKDNADIMFESEKFGLGVMSAEGFEAFDSEHVTVGYAWRYNTQPESDKESRDASEKVLTALRDELIAVNAEILQRAMAGETGLTMLEASDFLPDYENKSINFAGEDMTGDEAAMVVFLYIVVAVLAFIVAVTTLNTVTKEASVIGTLRASGYSRGEMVRHYMILPFASFFAGMVVGNLLGYTVMRDFMVSIYRSMYSFGKTETFWNSEAFLKTTLIPSIIMIVINVVILVWKMRIGPLQFLRRETSGRKKKRALKLSRRLPFTWRFRIRILLQNLPNYITMMVGIVLAAAIIIFGLMFQPLLKEVAHRIEDTSISRYQYILKTPEEATEGTAERFAIGTLETTRKDFKTDEVSVYGVSADSRYVKTAIPAGKALLSNGFMDKYGVKVGDTVSLYDKYADRNYDFIVAGEYPYEAALAVFMNLSEFNETFDKTPDYYSGYFADEELASLTKSNVYMTLDSSDFSHFADQLWKSFADFMTPVKWFGVLMFVLMVYLLAKQIIERNATSISMTKILGFTGGEIGGLYIVSTSLVVVASLLLAVPLVDRLLHLVFRDYLYQRMSGYLPYCISNDCYWKMILLGIGSYAAVVALQLWKISRIPKSDALKTLE
ncbi:MAG: ABC transporter permease [Lachnospiraceae bacterium]|nr:ABC transporter permease [Lachnospiraceae bacterium]